MRNLYKNIAGDTIIEVLLAIIVVSGTLGTAFATMNSGSLGTRAAQERVEALKHVETQIELLRVATDRAIPGIYGRTNGFCLSESGGTVQIHEAFAPSAPVGNLDTQDLPYAAPCSIGLIPSGYNVSISEAGNVFTIRARWENISGDNRDQIEIKYKREP
jgi:type II secretory pathway pseudopilin PulG